MSFYPRPGQWCLFHADLPDAIAQRHEMGLPKVHQTADGWYVGIFSPGQHSGPVVNGSAEPARPPRVLLVDENGNNVPALDVDSTVRNVAFAPEALPSLKAMTDKAHFPPGYVGNTAEHPRP